MHRTFWWLLAGLFSLILLGSAAAVPFVFPNMLQPQIQYLAGFMVLLAGVLAFWSAHLARLATERNNVREHQREVERSLRDRFTGIAGQISDKKAPIRQAAVYALSALANDWHRYGEDTQDTKLAESERQVCIDFLCSYLRDQGRPDTIAERSVRETVIERIRSHTLANRRGQPSWIGCQFNLSEANLSDANLSHAVLRGAVLEGANLVGSNLMRADLTYADLRKTELSDAKFIGAVLIQADLGGTDLSHTDLASVTYNDETIWPDGFIPPQKALPKV